MPGAERIGCGGFAEGQSADDPIWGREKCGVFFCVTNGCWMGHGMCDVRRGKWDVRRVHLREFRFMYFKLLLSFSYVGIANVDVHYLLCKPPRLCCG